MAGISRNTETNTFSLPPGIAQLLQQVAGEENRTVSALLREAILLNTGERMRRRSRDWMAEPLDRLVAHQNLDKPLAVALATEKAARTKMTALLVAEALLAVVIFLRVHCWM